MCREFSFVHSWQNGTRCRDGVNVLWCRSRLVWLVFEGSITACACFHLENFSVTCSCCFVLIFFLEVVRATQLIDIFFLISNKYTYSSCRFSSYLQGTRKIQHKFKAFTKYTPIRYNNRTLPQNWTITLYNIG